MKKGFTLIELIVVVVLVGILALFVTPNVIKIFNSNKTKLSLIQKNELKDAVEMYISDYCINPISKCYSCPFETKYNESTNKIVIKGNNLINLTDLSEIENDCNEKDSYIDSVISKNCNGNIRIKNNEIDLSNITCNFNER